MQKIFVLIRARTGHDFSHYKPGTIDRRIDRRMAVNHLQSLDEHLEMLQRTPREIDALFHELLIGVTSFFRDPDAYEKLDQLVLPQLIADKLSTGEPLRIWVSGCSTGGEAYSIAILVQERLEAARCRNLMIYLGGELFAVIDRKAKLIAANPIWRVCHVQAGNARRLRPLAKKNSHKLEFRLRDPANHFEILDTDYNMPSLQAWNSPGKSARFVPSYPSSKPQGISTTNCGPRPRSGCYGSLAQALRRQVLSGSAATSHEGLRLQQNH